MKTRSFISWVAGMLLASGSLLNGADLFTYGGFTFNQTSTPDVAVLLGNNSNFGGAVFSAGFPTQVTSASIDFPQGDPGFDVGLALNHLTGLNFSSVRAVNLPDGNNGTIKRHGIESAWSGGRGLPNFFGPDFVIYESGSSSNGVEGVMARVRYSSNTNLWSDWYYFPPDSYRLPTAGNPNAVFAFGFDLSEMGVAENVVVDRIQMANLIQADRMVTNNAVDLGGGVLVGSGRVLFDGSTSVLPDAGSFDVNRTYDTNSLDPDPFYVAALHDTCEAVPPRLTSVLSGTSLLLSWPAPSCYSLQSCTNLVSPTWTSVAEGVVLTNGTKLVTVSAQVGSAKFFRLLKP